jgi:glycosyltransferase involved in cell wall biosynthesis
MAGDRTPFTVTNVICRYNSASGGPPRTVSAIATAGVGAWKAELFTTDYVEAESDRLLLSDFVGRVVLRDRRDQMFPGSLLMALGLRTGFRAELIRDSRPDVLHLHGVWSLYLAAFAGAARKLRIPYVVTPHGMLEPWTLSVHASRKALALKTFQGAVMREAAALHATSQEEADNLRALGVTDAPIFVIPNSIDAPMPYDAAHQVDHVGRPGTKVLLFLSRVHPKKGLDMLLEAWSALRVADWQLLIVGHGETAYVEQLRRYCAAQRLETVRFQAHVDGTEREATFARASAFILPTYSENFGNAVGEAMIRGLPVITTTGTPWSIVAERKLGWYVEPTVESLKAALVQLFATDRNALAAMGERGRDYVQQHLMIDAVRPRLMEMYQTAMRRAAAQR